MYRCSILASFTHQLEKGQQDVNPRVCMNKHREKERVRGCWERRNARVLYGGLSSWPSSFPSLRLYGFHDASLRHGITAGSLDLLNWVRHFRWRDPSKILSVFSSPLQRTSEGLPTDTITTTIEGARSFYSRSTRVAFVFVPKGSAILNLWYSATLGLGHRKTSVVSES